MFQPIDDYALLSNLRCGALVSRAGSIDWFCPGRFDAPACFAALLGNASHGRWLIAPQGRDIRVERRYQKDTLVLDTWFSTPDGRVRVTDAMALSGEACHIIRLVEAESGQVPMTMSCVPRFQYGRDAPTEQQRLSPTQATFHHSDGQLRLTARQCPLTITDGSEAEAHFTLAAGEQEWFVLSFAGPDMTMPEPPDVRESVSACTRWWREWISHCQYQGPWEDEVRRSLLTLKAMTYSPGGGMVAAVTTSVPEVPGGHANYDYRFCWIRDAAFALKVLMNVGYKKEACAWRDWLLKSVSQHDRYMHALYRVDGTLAEAERELGWLPGYANSRPVRAGNAASQQYQLDLRGELMEVFHLARDYGLYLRGDTWKLQCEVMENLEQRWYLPDEGIWEFRTLHDHLTHSKVLSWAAFDRCIRDAERLGIPAPVDRWRRIRHQIREDVLSRGLHPQGGYFTQRYGSDNVDASLLMIPLVGFLPARDPRMLATIDAIERELVSDGLVRRYRVGDQANEEGQFIPCGFWLADNYWLAGQYDKARALFQRLLSLRNDVGLLSEEWDPGKKQLLGNFPQGLSHLALIRTAQLITTGREDYTSLT